MTTSPHHHPHLAASQPQPTSKLCGTYKRCGPKVEENGDVNLQGFRVPSWQRRAMPFEINSNAGFLMPETPIPGRRIKDKSNYKLCGIT